MADGLFLQNSFRHQPLRSPFRILPLAARRALIAMVIFLIGSAAAWGVNRPVISYIPSSEVFTVQKAIVTVTPTNSGGAASTWTITPALSAGLNFQGSTGQIMGSPTVAALPTLYKVKATNAVGSASTNLWITVKDIPPVISYKPSTCAFTVGKAIPAVVPALSGGKALIWCIFPELPKGLSFGMLNGRITGTPAVLSQARTYTVEAANMDGIARTTLTISVTANAPVPAFLGGTVASGAAVAGIVNVKDADGKTASANIDTTGHYSLDVSSLTPPFILYAQGAVNGHSVEMYSTAISAGTIDITPITNLILANALNATPDTAYANWSTSQVSSSAISTAMAQVQNNLGPLLTGAGVTPGTNLMTATFNADHTGLDAALDALSISYGNGIATITNHSTGSSYTENLANPAAAAGLPATDVAATQAALTDLQAINSILDTFASLWASGQPTAQQIQTALGANIASGYLDSGYPSFVQEMSGADGPDSGGFSLRAVLQAPITVPGFTRGYLTNWIVSPGSNVMANFEFVLNGSTWQMYGNQAWLFANMHPDALEEIDTNGTVSYADGFNIELEDDAAYAYNHGVRSAVVIGPGLAGGVVLGSNYPDPGFGILSNGITEYPGKSFINIPQDTQIQAIPSDATYTVSFYSQPAISVSAADTPIHVMQITHVVAPLLNAQMNQSLFPAISAPSGHAISALNIPGMLNVTWINTQNATVDSLDLDFGPSMADSAYTSIAAGATSGTLNTSTFVGANSTSAVLSINSLDADGRGFDLIDFFQ